MTTSLVSSSPSSAFTCSGSSPTLHLLGLGQVGCEFLDLLTQFCGHPLRLIAASDSTGTLWNPLGLDPRAVLFTKRQHGRWTERADAATLGGVHQISTERALALAAADVVVDATPTDLSFPGRAAARCRALLTQGSRIVFAAKDALSLAADEFLLGRGAGRVGCNAALGGAGARLAAELPTLARECDAVALVGNASTTAVIETIERGGSLEDGIAEATARGLLEPDPSQDLDGSDAAVKLAIVARALWGFEASPREIVREDLRQISTDLVRARRRRGATTRLVARGTKSGGVASLAVRLEEVPLGSPLAVPSDRAVYTYGSGRRTRIHVGSGLGPRATAEALLADLQRWYPRVQEVGAAGFSNVGGAK